MVSTPVPAVFVAPVDAYDPEPWHDLAVATVGAAAALAGLLFVAVSLNVERILKGRWLPRRAAQTLGLLTSLLLVTLFVLAPGQSRIALGIEIAAIGALLAVAAIRYPAASERQSGGLWAPGVIVIPSVLMLVAGVSLAVEHGGGLYWLLAALVCGFIGAVINAWVLLVEILR